VRTKPNKVLVRLGFFAGGGCGAGISASTVPNWQELLLDASMGNVRLSYGGDDVI